MEESIGMIVAANEIVQNPEVVGTALRTLSMRLRNTAGELTEMGEDAEGAAESITRLQEQLLELAGVNIMASATEFKSTFDILQELADVWGDLTDVQQAEVTRLVAGVRQGQVMAALMEGMGSAYDAATTAANAYGSAMRENEIWMNSVEGATRQFRNAMEELGNTMLQADWLIGFYNGLTGIVRGFSRIMQLGNGMVGQLVMISAALLAIKGVWAQLAVTTGIKNILDTFTALGPKLQGAAGFFNAMANSQSIFLDAGSEMAALATKTKGLTAAQLSVVAAKNKHKVADASLQALQAKGIKLTTMEAAAQKKQIAAQATLIYQKMGLQGARLKKAVAQATNVAMLQLETKGNVTLTASLWAKTKAIGGATKGLLAMAKAFLMTPFGKIAAVIGGIVAVFTAWRRGAEGVGQAVEDSIRSTQQAVSAYRSLRSEYTRINNELETTRRRMSQLQSQGTLSLIEQEELANLRAANIELERTARLLGFEMAQAQTEMSEHAQQLHENLSRSAGQQAREAVAWWQWALAGLAVVGGTIGAIFTGGTSKIAGWGAAIAIVGGSVATVAMTAETLSTYLAAVDADLANNIDNWNRYSRAVERATDRDSLQRYQQNLNQAQHYIMQSKRGYQEIASALEAITDRSEIENQMLENANIMLEAISRTLDEPGFRRNVFIEVFESEHLRHVTNQLRELARAGELSALTIERATAFNALLRQIGVSAEEAAATINQMYSPQRHRAMEQLGDVQMRRAQGIASTYRPHRAILRAEEELADARRDNRTREANLARVQNAREEASILTSWLWAIDEALIAQRRVNSSQQSLIDARQNLANIELEYANRRYTATQLEHRQWINDITPTFDWEFERIFEHMSEQMWNNLYNVLTSRPDNLPDGASLGSAMQYGINRDIVAGFIDNLDLAKEIGTIHELIENRTITIRDGNNRIRELLSEQREATLSGEFDMLHGGWHRPSQTSTGQHFINEFYDMFELPIPAFTGNAFDFIEEVDAVSDSINELQNAIDTLRAGGALDSDTISDFLSSGILNFSDIRDGVVQLGALENQFNILSIDRQNLINSWTRGYEDYMSALREIFETEEGGTARMTRTEIRDADNYLEFLQQFYRDQLALRRQFEDEFETNRRGDFVDEERDARRLGVLTQEELDEIRESVDYYNNLRLSDWTREVTDDMRESARERYDIFENDKVAVSDYVDHRIAEQERLRRAILIESDNEISRQMREQGFVDGDIVRQMVSEDPGFANYVRNVGGRFVVDDSWNEYTNALNSAREELDKFIEAGGEAGGIVYQVLRQQIYDLETISGGLESAVAEHNRSISNRTNFMAEWGLEDHMTQHFDTLKQLEQASEDAFNAFINSVEIIDNETLDDAQRIIGELQEEMWGLIDALDKTPAMDTSALIELMLAYPDDWHERIEDTSTWFEEKEAIMAHFIPLIEEQYERFNELSVSDGDLYQEWMDSAAAFREFAEAMGIPEGVIRNFEYVVEQLEELDDVLHDTEQSLTSKIVAYNNLKDTIAEATTAVNSFTSATSTMSNAIDEWNEYGSLQIGTVMQLMALGDEYLALLDFQNGALSLNTDRTEDMAEALREQAMATVDALVVQRAKAIVERELARLISDTTDEVVDNIEATNEQAGAYWEAAGAAGVLNYWIRELGGNTDDLSGSFDAMKQELEDFANMWNQLLGTADFTRHTRSGGSNQDPHLEEANRQIEELRWLRDRQYISEQTFYEQLARLNQKFFAGREKYLSEWRRLELETYRGINAARDRFLNNQLAQAQNLGDLNGQLEVYMEQQRILHEQANRLREIMDLSGYASVDFDSYAFSEMANELRELGIEWGDIQRSIWEAQRNEIEIRMSISVDNYDFEEQLRLIREMESVLENEMGHTRIWLDSQGIAEEDSTLWAQLLHQQQQYAERRIQITVEMFNYERELYRRQLELNQHEQSMTHNTAFTDRTRLLNQQLELQTASYQRLTRQLADFIRNTSEAERSTRAFQNAVREMEGQLRSYQQEMRSTIQAQKALYREQMDAVRSLQDDIVAALRNRIQNQKDLERDAHDARMRQLDEEADRIRDNFNAQINAIDDQIRA